MARTGRLPPGPHQHQFPDTEQANCTLSRAVPDVESISCGNMLVSPSECGCALLEYSKLHLKHPVSPSCRASFDWHPPILRSCAQGPHGADTSMFALLDSGLPSNTTTLLCFLKPFSLFLIASELFCPFHSGGGSHSTRKVYFKRN